MSSENQSFEQPPSEQKEDEILEEEKDLNRIDLERTDKEVESKELSDQDYFELSKKIGNLYSSYIDELTGRGMTDMSIMESIPVKERERLQNIIATTKEYQEQQELLVSVKEMGAKEILEQAFKEKKELLEDQNKYRLERLSKGIFAIFIDYNLFNELYQKERKTPSQAVAAFLGDGVSFIIIPEGRFTGRNQEIFLEENIPHETNHIVWRNLRRKEIIKPTEGDLQMENAFGMFQEELVSRIVGESLLGGYTHLPSRADEQAFEKFKKENPEKTEQILTESVKAKDLLYEIKYLLSDAGLRNKTIFGIVLDSRNFTELNKNLERVRRILKERPKEAKET